MSLSKPELDELIKLIGLTRDTEIDCDECLELVAEYGERVLAGRPIPEGLEAVRHHLAVCGECREEFDVLRRALEERS